MTDSTAFYRAVVTQVGQFISAYENLVLLADRIAADSSLSAAAATAAGAATSARPDLSTASFDNFKSAVTALQSLMNNNNAGVNTATVKLAFYQML